MTRGFTLIELLVTVGIIAILATTGIVSFGKVFAKARDARRISDIVTIAKGLDMYFVENDRYPARNWECDSSLGTQNINMWCDTTPPFEPFNPGNNWNLGVPPSSLKTLIDKDYLNSLPIDPYNTVNNYYEVYLANIGEVCINMVNGAPENVGNSSANAGCYYACAFSLETNSGMWWCIFHSPLLQ